MTPARSKLLKAAIVLGALGAAAGASAATAAPFPVPPTQGSIPEPGIEKVYWAPRCVWVNGPWGPQRRCRNIWINAGPGWGYPPPPPPPGWGWRPPPPRGWGALPPPPPPPGPPPSGYYRY